MVRNFSLFTTTITTSGTTVTVHPTPPSSSSVLLVYRASVDALLTYFHAACWQGIKETTPPVAPRPCSHQERRTGIRTLVPKDSRRIAQADFLATCSRLCLLSGCVIPIFRNTACLPVRLVRAFLGGSTPLPKDKGPPRAHLCADDPTQTKIL